MISANRRSIFLIVLALWLPFQAALAFAMPFCGHGRPAVVSGGGQAGHAGHHHPAGEHAHADHGPGVSKAAALATTPDLPGACDQCGLCHLACAGFLAPSRQASAPDVPGHVLIGATLPAVTNPHPDPLDRPPLAAA